MLSQFLLLPLLASAATASYTGGVLHPGALAAKRDIIARQSASPTDDSDSAFPTDDSDSAFPTDDSDSAFPTDDSDSAFPTDDSDSAFPTDGDDAAAVTCAAAIASVYDSLPTPPPDLSSWEESATFTDPCSISLPASISDAFVSYESEVLSWYTAHSDELSSALSMCPEASDALGAGADPTMDVCSTAAGGGGAASTTAAPTGKGTGTKTSGSGGSATGTGTTGGAGAAGTQSKNAGPRETGFIGAAVAAAGFLGVVAAL